MVYSVELSGKAAEDIDEALEWLAQHAPEQAANWIDGLLDAIGSLETFPFRCPIAPDSRNIRGEVRQLLYGKHPTVYRILYEVKQQKVFILHVRHGARDRLKLSDLS